MFEKPKTQIDFINDEVISDNDYLWKYLDLHKFLSLITSKSLHLTRLDKFEDNREGSSILHLLTSLYKKELESHPVFNSVKEIMTLDVMGLTMDKIEDELSDIQRFNFSNCWIIGDEKTESVAMWNLYSNPESLAIRIKYSEFKHNILKNGVRINGNKPKLTCSPVKYMNFSNREEILKFKNSPIDSVFIKDISFEHEKEFRIVANEETKDIPEIEYKSTISRKYQRNFHDLRHNYPGLKLYLFDFNSLKFEIVLHPKSPKWIKDNINHIVKLHKLDYEIFESNLDLS